jgi:hypothetical protein
MRAQQARSQNQIVPPQGSEYIYYEAQYVNDTAVPIFAQFIDSKSEPIVKDMSQYKLAITRFNIGMEALPMFVVRGGKRECNVSLYYQKEGLSATQTVFPSIPKLPVYTISYFLDSADYGGGLNITIQNMFDSIVSQYDAIHGAGTWNANPLTPKVAPGFTYDAGKQLFTLYSDPLSADTEADKVILLLTGDISELFLGCAFTTVPLPYSDPEWYRFSVFPNYMGMNLVTINSVDYIAMEQSYSSTAKWYTVNKLLITSRSLGTRKSFIGVLKASELANSNAIQYEILSDTYVNLSNTLNENPATQLVYIPINYKWIDCLKNGPLNQVDFSLQFLDEQGNFYPAKVLPGESFAITIVLAKNSMI